MPSELRSPITERIQARHGVLRRTRGTGLSYAQVCDHCGHPTSIHGLVESQHRPRLRDEWLWSCTDCDCVMDSESTSTGYSEAALALHTPGARPDDEVPW